MSSIVAKSVHRRTPLPYNRWPATMPIILAAGQPRVVVDAAVWTMLSIATVFFVVRLYCRLGRLGQLWWDDYILVGSWVLVLISTAVLTKMMAMGYLDTNMSEPKLFLLTKISHTCHLVSLALSKASFAVTLLRFTNKYQKFVVWFVIASIGIIFTVHVFLLWKSMCGLGGIYSLPGPCWDPSNPIKMNIVSSMYSALTDFVLALLPWQVFMGLQMKKEERISLAVAMSVGAVAGVTGVMKSVQSIKTLNHMDPECRFPLRIRRCKRQDTHIIDTVMYNMVLFWIFSLAEPNSTIIAASIPVLRVLFRDARAYYGGYSGSSPGAAGYLKSDNNTFHMHTKTRDTNKSRPDASEPDNSSDRSILAYAQKRGISRTTEVSVQYEGRGEASESSRGNAGAAHGDSFEMQTRYPINDSQEDGPRTKISSPS
ncbi:hypothetical protein HJFPF1_11119 [Paramyrothecium foliicola]|nr:hypothetical protein HJFPF1_11119 [Paramyrothecium foliicola]